MMMSPVKLLILLQAIVAESADGEALYLTKAMMVYPEGLLILLQAIMALYRPSMRILFSCI